MAMAAEPEFPRLPDLRSMGLDTHALKMVEVQVKELLLLAEAAEAKAAEAVAEAEAACKAEKPKANDWHSHHFCLFATAVEEAITEASQPASTDASEADGDDE